jgi:hypothetical protein
MRLSYRLVDHDIQAIPPGRTFPTNDRESEKGMPMPKVKYIASPNDIPAGQKYVLVVYGKEYAQTEHSLGLTITVARQASKTVSELSFLTAVHTGKGIAKLQGIATIFACPGPLNPGLSPA